MVSPRFKPEKYEFHILEAKDCESAYHLIVNPETAPFDIAFLDIGMPSYEAKGIYSGRPSEVNFNAQLQNFLLTMFTEFLKIKKQLSKILILTGSLLKNDLTLMNSFSHSIK
jgi:hypothetical protein